MHQRCSNPQHENFKHYGGRGIKVCERWKSFEAFMEDMGPRPTLGHSIERKQVNGDYEPSNCYWATQREQMRNIRNNVKVEIGGEERLLIDECERRGIPYQTAYMRLRRGMAPEQALSVGHFPKGGWRVTEPTAMNTSGFRGVSRKRGRWRATIVIDGKQRSLGTFDDPAEAHQAYLKAHEERREFVDAAARRKEKAT